MSGRGWNKSLSPRGWFHLPVHSGIGAAAPCVALTGGPHTGSADCRGHSTCHHPGSRAPWPLSSFCTFPSPAWSPCLGLVPPCPFAIFFPEKAWSEHDLRSHQILTHHFLAYILNLENWLEGTGSRKGLEEVRQLAKGHILAWSPHPKNPCFFTFRIDYFGFTGLMSLKGSRLRG